MTEEPKPSPTLVKNTRIFFIIKKISTDDLKSIKQKMKELLLKPRRNWTQNDKSLYEGASKKPLKDLLIKIK